MNSVVENPLIDLSCTGYSSDYCASVSGQICGLFPNFLSQQRRVWFRAESTVNKSGAYFRYNMPGYCIPVDPIPACPCAYL